MNFGAAVDLVALFALFAGLLSQPTNVEEIASRDSHRRQWVRFIVEIFR